MRIFSGLHNQKVKPKARKLLSNSHWTELIPSCPGSALLPMQSTLTHCHSSIHASTVSEGAFHRLYTQVANCVAVCWQVECVVETRDKTQSAQLRKTLSERYPSISWLDRWWQREHELQFAPPNIGTSGRQWLLSKQSVYIKASRL